MFTKLVIALGFMMVIAGPSAAFWLTGENFVILSDSYSFFSDVEAGRIDAPESPDEWSAAASRAGLFMGYVTGVMDVLGSSMLKVPGGTTGVEIVDAVCDFIESNNEYCVGSPAMHVVMAAIRDQWPEENGLESDQ